ncbi:MAG TPA: PQQ-binding-like beta-propeller repeat protein [Gemmatales bacterium]|nr:PQQ-binding-like beta-propeller repeat protein [Gemmatales bacterium]
MLSSYLLLSLLFIQPPDDWKAFHGGDFAGVRDNVKLPSEWSPTKNVAWAIDIPGLAWSSPVAWKGKVFLTTVIRDGKPEAVETAKKGLYFGGEKKDAPQETFTWKVYCIDEETGKILWEKVAHQGKADRGKHVKNSYASETPVVDAERLYVTFGNIGLFTYDHKGELLWKHAIESMPTTMSWGPAASPTIHDNRLYFVYDNNQESYIMCLDARTGSQVWKQPRDEKSNWASPYVWVNDKRTEIVTAGSNKIRSYDLEGKLLWELGPMSSITVPTPFAANGLLYVTSGYVMDAKNKPVYAIKPGASGDLTTTGDDPTNPSIAWVQPKAGPYMPTPLVYHGLCYILYDMGAFACYDAKTGAEIYSKQRFKGKTTGFTSSPWAYNGKVFCMSEDGDVFVIEAGKEFKQVGKNSMDELCMATPAITNKSLLIRTASKLYCIR